MAAPKVFISSTCFDLSEIREQLQKLVRSFGFDPILSEYGDVFYHPDLHTHDSCIYEVSNCQLFILIIGGRFGGQYISDKSKSITNAEYDAARKHKIPIFTYVRKGVLSSHHVYKQNKDHDFVSKIDYPSIDKKEHAVEIFRFIDEVKKSPSNNSIEGFEKFTEIESHLRKQWAGMFFDFLKTSEVKKQIDATNHLISGLSASSSKLEELVKSLYREISTTNAEATISTIEDAATTEEFFQSIMLKLHAESDSDFLELPDDFNTSKAADIDPTDLEWHEYLLKLGLFIPVEYQNKETIAFYNDNYHYTLDDPPTDLIATYNDGVKKSSKIMREKILKRFNKSSSTSKEKTTIQN